MSEIRLVRVSYAGSMVDVLNQIGAPTERLLNRLNLSEELLVVPGGFMTVPKCWEVYALAADYSGMPDIGLRGGLTPLEKHGQFGKYICSASTLYQAVMRFCIAAPKEMTHSEFHVLRQRDKVWFCGGYVEGTEDEVRQLELYRIALYTQIIRLALGPDWKPGDVRLQSRDGRHLHDTNLFRNTNIEFSCGQPAIAVPHIWLSLPLIPTRQVAVEMPGRSDLFPEFQAIPEFESVVKEIIRTRILAGSLDIWAVSHDLGMSARTLQRHLNGRGASFSKLAQETRVEVAKKLLQDAELKISEIAGGIGYSEPTHFTRAFRQITGMTPRQYREAICQN